MERDGDQGPDAASIKPVSSLRAKFENLGQHASDHDAHTSKYPLTPSGLRPVDSTKTTSLSRASLDLPRPHSPWQQLQDHVESQHAPYTPGSLRKGSESPTRSNHKRPMSMHLASSPHPAPALSIESPNSPSKPLFFARAQSRSPERIDTTAFGRVRDLVSHHSSRSSSRQPSPGASRSVENSNVVLPESLSIASNTAAPPRPKSPIPPPVNRADKPKIPAKPRSMSPAADVALTSRSGPVLRQSKVSPFNTPPGSDDEEAATNQTQSQPAPRRSVDMLQRRVDPAPLSVLTTYDVPQPRLNDPRMMGFNVPKSAVEKKDPRQLGFSPPRFSGQPPPQPAREVKTVAAASRALPPLTAPVKDARAFGFGTPVSREPPRFPPSERSLPPTLESNARPSPPRDARQYGFTGAPITPVDSPRVDLPPRSAVKIPPPRPSEESKRPSYTPGISRASSKLISQHSVNPQARNPEDTPRTDIERVDVARSSIPNSTDTKFPPPPKRGVFNENDTRKTNSLSVPADTSNPVRRRSFDMQNGEPDTETPVTSSRRSFDTHNGSGDPETATPIGKSYDSDEAEEADPVPIAIRQDYPDGSQTNRRPPILDPERWRIHTRTDGKVFDVCGRLLCTAGYHTRIYDLDTASEMLDLNHGETVKTTAVIFKPGQDIKSEGKRLWIGNNLGDLQEIDLETHVTIAQSSAHNRKEIFRILRHEKDLWTLDEAGNLFVWPADETGVPNLKYSHITHKLLKPPTWVMGVHDTLWAAAGKEIRIYRPGHDSSFNVVRSPLVVQGTGDVTSGTYSESTGRVYIGHIDGKVSIYSSTDYSCIDCIKVSDYKINAMAMVGDYLWAVFKTGKVYVYDISGPIWKIKKDWKAHDGPATGILLDPSSVWLLGRLQVATTGHDQYVKLWDGLLEEDWIESTMHARDAEYCTFRDVRAAVTTWNCGAVSPSLLHTDFIADAIHAHERDPPQILVFGFQEVVDLENRTLTAKSILNFGKKKDKDKMTDQQSQAKVYREWRDYLASCIEKYIPQHEYTELHTSSLIGLFSCVFVRASERRNITRDARQEVKCGMGGHYGNKGALLCRFVFDSSSLCFINCHLAAGQSQTSNRNNDIATILESESLPGESDLDVRASLFVGGGDGRQILDHEICILNGDLNYRIDTIPRNTIIQHINNNDLAKLLERDQLNVSRRRIAGFRLAPFTELPITFPPTYKYDVGSDRYDSSEKKRSPAWCDRLLCRSSSGRVKQLEYTRHEGVFYSDHRPVSGVFRITIKKVDESKRRQTLKSVNADFTAMRKAMLQEGCIRYLVDSFGLKREEARILIKGAK